MDPKEEERLRQQAIRELEQEEELRRQAVAELDQERTPPSGAVSGATAGNQTPEPPSVGPEVATRHALQGATRGFSDELRGAYVGRPPSPAEVVRRPQELVGLPTQIPGIMPGRNVVQPLASAALHDNRLSDTLGDVGDTLRSAAANPRAFGRGLVEGFPQGVIGPGNGTYIQERDAERRALRTLAQQEPITAGLSDAAASTISSLATAPGAAAAMPMRSVVGRYTAAGALEGATHGLGRSDSLEGAAVAIPAGAALGGAGAGLASGGGHMARAAWGALRRAPGTVGTAARAVHAAGEGAAGPATRGVRRGLDRLARGFVDRSPRRAPPVPAARLRSPMAPQADLGPVPTVPEPPMPLGSGPRPPAGRPLSLTPPRPAPPEPFFPTRRPMPPQSDMGGVPEPRWVDAPGGGRWTMPETPMPPPRAPQGPLGGPVRPATAPAATPPPAPPRVPPTRPSGPEPTPPPQRGEGIPRDLYDEPFRPYGEAPTGRESTFGGTLTDAAPRPGAIRPASTAPGIRTQVDPVYEAGTDMIDAAAGPHTVPDLDTVSAGLEQAVRNASLRRGLQRLAMPSEPDVAATAGTGGPRFTAADFRAQLRSPGYRTARTNLNSPRGGEE